MTGEYESITLKQPAMDAGQPPAPTAHGEVQRLTLRPGDRIVLRYPYHLPEADKQRIAAHARRDLGLGEDVPLLVLDNAATVAVIGPEPAAAQDEAAFLEASIAV